MPDETRAPRPAARRPGPRRRSGRASQSRVPPDRPRWRQPHRDRAGRDLPFSAFPT